MGVALFALETLSAGAAGSDVANLQAVLTRLDLIAGVPPDELATQRLGPGTAKAVQRLFVLAALGDNPTGAIEARAAVKLNDFLVSRRLLAEASGGVADRAGAPAAGDRIVIQDARNLDGA